MSIQRRLAISITLVLLLSLTVGFGLTYEHVISKVRTELQAALAVGAYAALNTTDLPDDAIEPARKLSRIVAAFDGDRHVKAIFKAPDDRIISQSRLLPPEDPAPDWFYRLVTSAPAHKQLTLPEPLQRFGSLVLQADPRNEVAEAWSDTRLTLIIMVLFFAMVLMLAFITIRAALAPLRDVCAALERIGDGDYRARIDPSIGYELAPLRDGVNGMAAHLDDMRLQNHALNEQIMSLQEEERAELARDLHDDVAPFLFAVGADAAMIRQFLANGAPHEVMPRAESIAEAVKHMQRHLKDVLRRLAPGALLDLGLAGAIDNLIGFWKTRQPLVAINASVEGESLDPPCDAVAFRVVQEAISNAIRHGRPHAIDVMIDVDDGTATIVIEDDGIGFKDGAPTIGFGLRGMQERIRSVRGSLRIGNRRDVSGARLEAILPIGTGMRPESDAMSLTRKAETTA